jgi:hypothetical protein
MPSITSGKLSIAVCRAFVSWKVDQHRLRAIVPKDTKEQHGLGLSDPPHLLVKLWGPDHWSPMPRLLLLF